MRKVLMPKITGRVARIGMATRIGVAARIGIATRISMATRIGAAAVLAVGAVAALAVSQASASPATSCGTGPTVTSHPFGQTVEPYTGKPTEVLRYTLTNCRGVQVKILTFGGITQSITVPGRDGQKANVVLGFKTLADYVKFDSPPVTANGGPYFGETIGRYGNRIAKGTFQLNGTTYHLPINNGVNSLHGGLVGFGNHVWASQKVQTASSAGVQLTLVSPNGDQGYPAQLTVVVTYTLNNAGQLRIHYKATNDSPTLATVVNLTNHSYFNLAGEASPAGSAYRQLLQINADRYTPTDQTQIPLGTEPSVKGTPFDFTSPHPIGSRIDDVSAPDHAPAQFNQLLISQGYDHNWVLNEQTPATTGPEGLNLAARASDPASGRELTVWTDQPGVQFYSGNFLNGTLVGISGHTYRQGAGYTFETQHFPNSPNQPNFPSTVLGPGNTLNSTTIFAFSS
jgi:aldose 1-epimerase